MKKFIIILLIISFCNMFTIYSYDKLTDVEAKQFLEGSTVEEAIEIVQDYDYLEHTAPTVTVEPISYLLFDTDLFVHYDGLSIEHGKFSYHIDIDEATVYDFVPKKSCTFKIVISVLAGAVVGSLLGYTFGVLNAL